MKIIRLTSPLPDVLHLSSPRPRLRHGRQLVLLSYPNLTLNPCAFSCVLSLTVFPPFPNFPNCSSSRESALVFADDLRSHFSVSQPKTLCSRARDLHPVTCPEESHSSFCSPFSPTEFFLAATNLPSSTATGPNKVAYPVLKHHPRSGMDLLQHIFNLSSFCIPFLLSAIYLLSFSSIRWETLSILLLLSGLSLSPHVSQSFLNASFCRAYFYFWSLTPFSLPARPVSTLGGLLYIKFCSFLSSFRMGLGQFSLLSISIKFSFLSAPPPPFPQT